MEDTYTYNEFILRPLKLMAESSILNMASNFFEVEFYYYLFFNF